MAGIGTICNMAGILAGGAAGLFFSGYINDAFRRLMITVCGLAFFEWQDEWWKSGETQDDAQHHAPEDPEEWFGIYGLGPEGSLEAKGPIPEAVRQIFLEEHHAK